MFLLYIYNCITWFTDGDTPDLGSSALMGVKVRVLSTAQKYKAAVKRLYQWFIIFYI